MRTRVKWIDIAKGIGIIFVIYGHVIPQIDRYIINHEYSIEAYENRKTAISGGFR